MNRALGLSAILLLACLETGAGASIHPLLRPILDAEPGAAVVLPLPLRDPGAPELPAEGERLRVWVRARDGGAFATEDRPLIRRARWSAAEIRAALADPMVESIRPAIRCKPHLDESLLDTHTTATHDGSGIPPIYAGLTGARVVVGIVDSGIDLDHGDFQDANGDTRILGLWDQTSPLNDHPVGFDYGKEWTAAQIDEGLATEIDQDGHGTHVAGIAAGDGSATGNGQPPYRYVGMAPDAVIVFVKTDYWDSSLVDGVQYIMAKADSIGYPVVVNLSLGSQWGAHDGSDDFDQAMSALSGPGHIIVGSAGNETGWGIHAETPLSPTETRAVTLKVGPYTPAPLANNDEINLDGWYDGGVNISILVRVPGGETVGPVARRSRAATDTPGGLVEISNAEWDPPNGDENFTIRIVDTFAIRPPAQGIWTIEFRPATAEMRGDDGAGGSDGAARAAPWTAVDPEVDIWNWYSSMWDIAFEQGLEEAEIVGSPATADSVIAVGAYVSKIRWTALDGNNYGYVPAPIRWDIADFSSIGPRRDGVLKPDIAAPGMGIGAALSQDYSPQTFGDTQILRDGVHGILQGTSMASPHVAGLIALVYQAYGPISVKEAMGKIAATARSDDFTGPLPNATWGFGKFHAREATGYRVPVVLLEAEATQEGEAVRVRFLLADDAGVAPLPIHREGPGSAGRAMLGWTTEGPERAFVDSTLAAEGLYRYWLALEDGVDSRWLGPAEIDFSRPGRPGSPELALEVTPNPFRGSCEIRWAFPGMGPARLSIFNAAGRRVRAIDLSGDPTAGAGRQGGFVWDGGDGSGGRLPSGVYWMRLEAGESESLTRKVLRLR